MKAIYAALVAASLTCAGSVEARPVVLEPVATLPAPPGGYTRSGAQVAIDGDFALITGFRPNPVDPGAGDSVSALLYRRTPAGWVYDSTLIETAFNPTDISYVPTVAMRDGFAATNFGGLFRRTATGWVREANSGGLGPDIEYSGGRFVFGTGEGDWGANVAERDAAGVWRYTRIQGPGREGDNDNNGGPLDIDGNTVAIAAPEVREGEIGGPHLYRFTPGTGWHYHSRPTFTANLPIGEELAIRGNEFFVDSSLGSYVFRNGIIADDWNADWRPVGRLQAVDSYTSRTNWGSLEKSPDFISQYRFSQDLGTYVHHLFRADEEGHYSHVATLTTADRTPLGGRIDIQGRRIIVSWNRSAQIFELPEEGPFAGTVLSDSFGAGSPSTYAHDMGDWRLVTVGNTTVYRQLNVTGDGRIVRNTSERRDGAIQVDVRPRAFNGNDRWFGLVARYTDAQNYYYVTARSSNRIELKRNAGGVFATLASAPLTVTLGRNYRLRLESVGTWHRVYVNDRLVLTARDATHAQGKLGLMTSRASADFDNLYITPNNYMTIYSTAFTPGEIPGQPLGPWTNTGTGAWSATSAGVYAQSSVAGDARAFIGAASAEDQSVSVRARAIAFAAGSATEERWFGALLRYVDDNNYALVTLRSSNRISLRQRVNGQARILAQAPLTVTPGTWYSLRVEAGRFSTNVYVNGELALEGPALQTAPRGQVGLVTFKAAADYDDFLAYQP